MEWIAYALIAPLFWAVSNFLDKFVLGHHAKGIVDYTFFSTISNLPFCIILIAIFGMPAITADAWIPLSTGIALMFSYVFYAKALEQGDTSTLVVMFKLLPVVTVILAYLFLGQTLSPGELIGFFIALGGAIAVSLDRKRGRFMNGFGMILIAIAMWAAMSLLSDYGLARIPFWDYVIIDSAGIAFFGLGMMVIPSVRRQVLAGLSGARAAKYTWYTANNVVDFTGQIAIKKAFALAPSVGLVTVVAQVQSAYAIIIGALLTVFVPHLIKEDISPRTLTKKIIGAVVMFAGIAVLVMTAAA